MLSLVVSAMLTISVFAGCNFGNSDGGSNSSGSKPTTLTWWMVGDQPKDYSKVFTEVNKYLKEKINVELDLKIAGYGDYTTKMNAVISSGENYDMAWTSNWSNPFVQQANKGAYMKLNDLIEKEGKPLKEFIPQVLWDSVTIKGDIYGVPTYKDSALMPYFVFSKEYVDKYKVDYTKMNTLESLEPFLKEVKSKEPQITPFEINANEGYHGLFDEFEMILDTVPVGVELSATSNFKVVNPFETKIVKDKLTLLNRWYNEGLINKDAPTRTESSKFRLVSGQHGYPHADADWSSGFGYNVVSTQRFDSYYTTSSAQGSITAISSGSKNGSKAMEFITLINTDSKLRNMVAFGLENVHYKKTGDNTIEKIGKDFDGLPQFAQGTFFNMYVVDPASPKKWDDLKQANEVAKKSPILGFIFDTKPVEPEIAAATNAYSKFKGQLTTGAVDPNKGIQDLASELDKAGYKKIIDEAQKQLDEFMKTKK